ncbi:MAG TPA: prepilin-type N-terminal cleavage/methylation domain-containing protein [Solirubrobacteraceae bacterium]|nr:prepilin-type N-terminal cleavage/methylation domain-containing protein [Solirubrobacteraceae bacterium]
MSTRRTSPREDGFTLVELLVATTMALIVFAVTLSTLAVFSDSTQALNQQNRSQNQARLGINQIVSQLRNVASTSTPPSFVERATPDDLVFQTVSVAAGVSTVERVRYCVGTAAGPASQPLYVQIQTTVTAAIPWAANACPDTSGGATAASLIPNTTNVHRGVPVFTYDGSAGSLGATPTDLTAIRSVGIDLFVNPDPGVSGDESELQSSALLRNAQSGPVAAFTWSQGTPGSVNLDAGVSYSPSGEPLTYAWSCAPVACSSSARIFTWQPGAGSDTVTLTVTDQAGLSTSIHQAVTIS